jgi:hypothetical protein
MVSDTLLLSGTIAAIAFTVYTVRRPKAGSFPPGPHGLPLVGCLFEWPSVKAWHQFTQWRSLYDNIVYCNVAGTHMVVLNSFEVADDLLNKRRGVYSSRPQLTFAGKLVGWEDSPIMCSDSHCHFEPSRHLMKSAVGSGVALEQYTDMMQHETCRFVFRVTRDPELVQRYLRK